MQFGRYEYSAGKSHKFWEIRDNGDGTATAEWGRIGRSSIGEAVYDLSKAHRKIVEKIAKGYELAYEFEEISEDQQQILDAAERVIEKRSKRKADTKDWLNDLKKMAGDK